MVGRWSYITCSCSMHLVCTRYNVIFSTTIEQQQKQADPVSEVVSIQSQTNNTESMLQAGTTPLHYTAGLRHTAIAEMLLKAGADVKATDKVRSNL